MPVEPAMAGAVLPPDAVSASTRVQRALPLAIDPRVDLPRSAQRGLEWGGAGALPRFSMAGSQAVEHGFEQPLRPFGAALPTYELRTVAGRADVDDHIWRDSAPGALVFLSIVEQHPVRGSPAGDAAGG